MSTLKVDAIRHNSATSDAITTVADGTCTAKLTSVGGGQLSHRNLVINGAQKICQRGNQTNISTAANNYVTDRFALYENGGAAFSGLHQDSGTDLPEFPKCLRADCTTASTYTGTHEAKIAHYFEGQDLQHLNYGTASNQKLTLSFYVRSNQAATYAIWFYRGTGNRQNGKTYTINSANTWEKKTVTINGDASSAMTNDNSGQFRIEWILMTGPSFTSGTNPNGTWETRVDANRYAGHTATIGANTNDYFDITGVQLEVGDTSTSFEHRSFDTEYLRCCRYYQTTTYAQYGNTYNACGAYAGSSTSLQCANLGFKTVMRTNPTVVFINWNSGTDHTVRNSLGTNTVLSSPTYYTMPHGVNAVGTSGGLSSGVWYQFNYTADAEIT